MNPAPAYFLVLFSLSSLHRQVFKASSVANLIDQTFILEEVLGVGSGDIVICVCFVTLWTQTHALQLTHLCSYLLIT